MKKLKKALLGAPQADSAFDLHGSARAGDVDKLKKMVQAGANVNARDEGNRTPLHWAAHEGQLGCLNALLEAGADVHATNKNNNTPLHLASSWGNTECVSMSGSIDACMMSTLDNLCIFARLGLESSFTPLPCSSARLYLLVSNDVACPGINYLLMTV